MAITITEPIDTISGILTDVIAANTQALYNAVREDDQVDEVASLAQGIQVWITGDVSASYLAGDVLYVSQLTRTSDGALVQPETVGTVASDSVFSGGFTKINIVHNLPLVTIYSGVSIDGYINNLTLKENYRLVLEVYDGATLMMDKSSVFTLPNSGLANLDIKSTIIDYMDLNGLQYVEYSAEFTPTWEGSSESADVTDDILAINGKKQIIKTGGALMYEYLPVIDAALYLTKFINPLMWRGWKRTASFIIDSNFTSRTGDTSLSLVQYKADINKVLGAQIDIDAHTIAVPRIQSQDVAETTDTYTLLNMLGVTSTDQVITDLYFEMQDECNQPIMVEWLNSLGAYEQHLFAINQDFINEGGDSENVNSPTTGNIATFKGGKSRLIGPSVQKMRITSERQTSEHIRALSEIKSSKDVRIFLSKDGTEYVNVVVSGDTSTPFQSRYDINDFSIELEFPDDFDFFEGKSY